MDGIYDSLCKSFDSGLCLPSDIKMTGKNRIIEIVRSGFD